MADDVGNTAETILFPPYGLMPKIYEDWANDEDPTPSDWLPQNPDRINLWRAFFADTLGKLEQVLWPAFRNGAWPAGSYAHRLALTEADFRTFYTMQTSLAGRGLDTTPSTPLVSNVCPTHRVWYLKDDGQITGMEDRYRHYDRTFSVDDANLVRTTFVTSRQKKESTAGKGSVTMQFKRMLQRPRAYQMAFIMGKPHGYEEALTADTPSMSSGHCLQGMIGTGGVFEFFIQTGRRLVGDHAVAMRQYMVDIGDRRVMAGIHYPSDCISSWIISLLIAPYVFREPSVQKEMALAIKQSIVYGFLVRSGEPSYQASLALLQSLF